MYENKLVELKSTKEKLSLLMIHMIEMKKEAVAARSSHLKALSPDGVLNRGYSIMQDESGKVIKKTSDIEINQLIKTVLKDGVVVSKVTKKEKKHA